MEILFLGTGAGVPAKARNVTSIALKLLEERNAVWLFDCGEATQHQILRTTLKPRKVEKIFITHLHGDHIFGLPGFLGSRSFQGGESPLVIYGPKGIKDFVEVSLRVSETHVKYPLSVIEIGEGTVFEDGQFTVEARRLNHGIESFGYRIMEKDKPGALDAEKLQKEGIHSGPVYRLLKEGRTVTLDDGRTINGKDYLGPAKKGRVVAILGDTRPSPAAVRLAQNADLLIHEATFNRESEKMAHDYFHSTTFQAAKTAKEAGAKQLLLTHISSRYGKEDWPVLEQEAKTVFPESLLVHDFMEVPVS
ncbi:ribonuclease Z [Weizmannia acidilactici]|uniref:ribonuclease Z n=1 Tax=Weizmannia acidilactici TaxID=2607726 RepID=UPI00124E0DC0|nr:ribonuclease Z [Weizmannia acidilactici]GER66105.1 ribonuclease Z [Weizmannia acidilactici]